MKWEQRRLLEMAGLLRRGTPDRLLFEGEEDSGGDDPFASDDSEGDDPFSGDDDDPFASDDGGGDDAEAGGEESSGPKRIPPDELETSDIEQFGSPRFLDIEQNLKGFFNNSMKSAGAAAQGLEVYPGQAIPDEPTPAKDDEPDEPEEPAADESDAEGEDEEEKNESFYRYGNRRDKWLINEAMRLLNEAESTADIFDMENFAVEIANYLDNIHKTTDVEAGIFNAARQMLKNNFPEADFPEMEQKFIDMLSAVSDGKWSFKQDGFEGDPEPPVAVGASSAGA